MAKGFGIKQAAKMNRTKIEIAGAFCLALVFFMLGSYETKRQLNRELAQGCFASGQYWDDKNWVCIPIDSIRVIAK